MGKILDWKKTNLLFVYIESEDLCDKDERFSGKNHGWISEDGLLQIESEQDTHAYRIADGGFDDYSTGDIVSILPNGFFSMLYDADSLEVDIFVSSNCNSNCVMCPLPEATRQKDIKHIEWLIEYIDILPEDVAYVNITGGEPTLAKDGFLIVMDALRRKFDKSGFQLLSNGRSLADIHFLENVVKVSPVSMRFAIPIHSSNAETHDAITRAKGSFVQTDRGIKNLLMLHQKVEIRIVISARNIEDLDDTAQYIVDNYPGVFCVNFIGMEMMGNAVVNKDSLWIDYSIAFAKAKSGIDLLVRNGIDVQLYNFPLCAVDRGYWHIAAKSITDYKVRFMDDCDECRVKEICGGFFVSTKQVMKPQVFPIRD